MTGKRTDTNIGIRKATEHDLPQMVELSKDLMVHQEYRHRGVGEHLFNAAKAWYSQQGIRRIEVRAAVTNEISTRFWRKMGFKPYLETLALSLAK